MTSAQNDLRAMAAAGARAAGCAEALAAEGGNVVSALLRGQGEFYEWDHYPKGDVYDAHTGAQYYYHAHPPAMRADIYGAEHGHFHTFMRAPRDGGVGGGGGGTGGGAEPGPPAHLIAVSMDRRGEPVRLFTANRWVTGETWRRADEAKALLAAFKVEAPMTAPGPLQSVNGWITAMAALFRPVIERLLDERDAAVAAWAAAHPDMSMEDVFEDRALEITSYADISLAARTAEINAALSRCAPHPPPSS